MIKMTKSLKEDIIRPFLAVKDTYVTPINATTKASD